MRSQLKFVILLLLITVVVIVIGVYEDQSSQKEPDDRIEQARNEELKRVTGNENADIHHECDTITTDEFIAGKHPGVLHTPGKASSKKCNVQQ